jgi:murein DD-endopeptidase MepM/ murein hydrolase activator NlpD
VRLLPRRHLAAALGAALVVGLVPGAFAAPSSSDLRRDLAEVTRAVEEAEHTQDTLTERIARLERSVARAEQQTAAVRDRLGDRARAAYTRGVGQDQLVLSLLTAGSAPTDTIDRVSLLGAVSRDDDEAMQTARVAIRRLRISRQQLVEARAEAAATDRKLTADSKKLEALLKKLAAQQATRPARASRSGRDTGSGAVVATGGRACLVGPSHSFTDTYGESRGGGRAHEGVDVFAPYGSGVYAVESGTIKKAYSSSRGGLTIFLRGNSGTEYWYMHESSLSVSTGQSVSVGQRIGSVGTSGNAQGKSPHVHFEVHPGGGGPVNPTPIVRGVC